MRRAAAVPGLCGLLLAVGLVCAASARKSASNEPLAARLAQSGSAVLKVSLRLQDDSAFIGIANVRVTPSVGPDLTGAPSGTDGETVFNGVPAGSYMVEADAPGFIPVRQQTQIESGNRVQTLFLILKPKPQPALAPAPATQPPSWIPAGIDAAVPPVEPGVACPLPQVIGGVGRRMKELVDNLQKFDATEHVEHFRINSAGQKVKPQDRTFDYVVAVKLEKGKVADLEEYRNGSLAPKNFPANIATTGMPTMALAFHPEMVSEFNLSCEGLGQWDGQPSWQLHFAQRPDRPNQLRFYSYHGVSFPLPLKGRVWIDAGTFQIRHFESELMHPIPEIELEQERISINYGPVKFHSQTQQLWLPLEAEIYWERGEIRMYRRHTYSNFKIFEVQSDQQIQALEGSYCFTNTSDHDISGILVVSPEAGVPSGSASTRFTIPAGQNVCKLVGTGKDLNVPVDKIASATFMHDGSSGSIKADANLVKPSALDIVPETDIGSIKP